VNAAILISAWSAAASDVYISSRFLFFLAREGHAPAFLAFLTRYPRQSPPRHSIPDRVEDMRLPRSEIPRPTPVAMTRQPASPTRLSESDNTRSTEESNPVEDGHTTLVNSPEDVEAHVVREVRERRPSNFILPLASVAVSSSVGLLAYMNAREGGPTKVSNASSVPAIILKGR
jgi:yeast amino acid transporter